MLRCKRLTVFLIFFFFFYRQATPHYQPLPCWQGKLEKVEKPLHKPLKLWWCVSRPFGINMTFSFTIILHSLITECNTMLPLSNLGLHSKEQQWGRVNTKSYQEKQYLKRLSTYVWFFNHIKFSINLKIRKRTHLCIQCLYNTILHQWFGGVCHPFLWWFISLNSNFQENVQEVCFCKLQNSWFWWFL